MEKSSVVVRVRAPIAMLFGKVTTATIFRKTNIAKLCGVANFPLLRAEVEERRFCVHKIRVRCYVGKACYSMW